MFHNGSFADLFYDDENTAAVKLGEVAAKIANYNFDVRYDTIALANLIQLPALQAFLFFYKGVVAVKKGKFIPVHKVPRPHVAQFLVVAEDALELCDTIQWLSDASYDNRGKFIVVCTSNIAHECDELLVFETLGKNLIANVVYLKLTIANEVEAFTYFPVNSQKCWQHNPIQINVTFNCEKNNCFKSLFPAKFDNIFKCNLVISTFEQPPYMLLSNGTNGLQPYGRDGDTLKYIVNLLNASLVIVTPSNGADWGHFVGNNWTGSLGDVFNHRAHGSMCSTPLTPNKYGNFQISVAYDSMDMVWAAALPDLKPSWEKLLYPLPVYLRIVLLFMFIAIIFLNNLKNTQLWKTIAMVLHFTPRSNNLLLYSWTIFLGLSVRRIPRKMPFRIMVCSWLWYCMTIRCLYQATLVSSMKLDAFENSLENFSDVLVRNYPFGGLPSLREYYAEDRRICDNWINVELAEAEAMLDLITGGETDFVVALNKETIIEYLLKYNGARNLQILPEKVVNSPSVIYFSKRTHLSFPIDKLLTAVFEGGFTHQLYSRYANRIRGLKSQLKSREAKALKLVHFTGSFVILALGWFLAAIFFGIEVFYESKPKSEKKNCSLDF